MLATRSVTTTGHGMVAVPHDTAVLTVVGWHRAATLSEALAGAESARAALVTTARGHVSAEAIVTRGLATWPQHDDQGRPNGYEARHSLEVRCAGLEVAATVLQALADEAGDRLSIDGVTLAATPSADDLAAAREAAYADARGRAEHLAALAGATLGAVVSVSEGMSHRPLPAHGMVAAKSAVGLEGGSDDVASSVTVTWELG